MAENVGAIYYTVEADTAKLLNSTTGVDASLDRMNQRFGQTDKAASKAEMRMTKTAAAVKGLGQQSVLSNAALGALSGLLSGLASLRTATVLVQMAESYNEMAERIRMATSSTQEYRMVQDRLLDTANRTYRSLAEAQEVYIRTADSLRSMGYSTSEVLDITDSLSYLFVTNAASADRAETAISAYSKAINKGKVEADAWESILSATPSIINDIAVASGKSAAEIRQLGASGKLTAQQLNEGLRQSLESNRAAADGMATTVKDALVAVRNNLSVLIGEANQATGVTTALSDAIMGVAEAIQSTDVHALVREIDALQSAMAAVDAYAKEWLKPFMVSTDEATNYLPTSFADSVIATAKEIDKLSEAFTGTVGAVQGIWQALSENIPAFFQNAWAEVLQESAEFVNSLSSIVNKPLRALGMEGIGTVSWGATARKEIVSITDAASQGWEKAARSAGAYDAIAGRMADKAISRAMIEWERQLSEETQASAKAVADKTKATEKLSAAQKKDIRDREANVKVIKSLTQALYEAGLKGEALAVAKAKASLNPAATPKEVALVEDLAKAIYKVEAAERFRAKGDGSAEKAIRGDVGPLSGGAFDDQFARYEAEAKAEEERYAAQLERLQEAKDLDIQLKTEYWTLEEQLAREHADRMAQIEQAKMQVMLQAGQQGFAAMADVIKTFAGKQNALYKAMFAASKAFAIAEATINAYGAIQKAWNSAPWPANLAAVAATTPKVMAVVAAIGSATMGSGKQYGGSVSPQKMYRINETGAPEVLNLANGQQYLLPNQRGEVVSNRDAGGVAAQGSGGSSRLGVTPLQISLSLHGSWFSQKDIRRLAADLNEAIGDGVRLRIT